MDTSFSSRFAVLAATVAPGTVLTCTAEPCILYEVLPQYGEIIVKYPNHGYDTLKGDDIVNCLKAMASHEKDDFGTWHKWMRAATAPRSKKSRDIVNMLLTRHMWDEFNVMVDHKL